MLAAKGLEKREVLVALYTDKVQGNKKLVKRDRSTGFYTTNEWLKLFHAECDAVKRGLQAKLGATYAFSTTSASNPLSSWASKVICHLENQLLQQAVALFTGDGGTCHVGAPMFDGLMVHREAEVDLAIERTVEHVEKLRAMSPLWELALESAQAVLPG